MVQTGALSQEWKWKYRLQVRPDQALPGVSLGTRPQALGRGARLTRESEMFKTLEIRGPKKDRSLKGHCLTGSSMPRDSHLPSRCGQCTAARRWPFPWCSLPLELFPRLMFSPEMPWLPFLQCRSGFPVWWTETSQIHAPSVCIPVEVACWHPGAQYRPRWQEEGDNSWLDFFK